MTIGPATGVQQQQQPQTPSSSQQQLPTIRCFSRLVTNQWRGKLCKRRWPARSGLMDEQWTSPDEAMLQDIPFMHYRRPRGMNPKFKSPRKRASKLFHNLKLESISSIRENKPQVFEPSVQPGDAVCVHHLQQGLPSAASDHEQQEHIEMIRGVVISKENRGLGSSLLLRDVIAGCPVERRIFTHHPLIRKIDILEKNFVYKGKRKVKKAKLYFLRDRNPNWYNVTAKYGPSLKTPKPQKKKKKKN